jgi:hypothetical protein
MEAQFAVIGTDGTRPVVWGIGTDPEVAMEEAQGNLIDAGCDYAEDLLTVSVTSEQAELISGGEVSTEALGIELPAAWLESQ